MKTVYVKRRDKRLIGQGVYIVSNSPLNGRRGVIKGFRDGGNVFVFVYDHNDKTGAIWPLHMSKLRLLGERKSGKTNA